MFRLSALAITTLDLPTLLAASGVHPSWRGNWLVFLKKALVRRRTTGCQEMWTPEAAKRVGRSSVVMARAESRERNAVC
ncbi:hypothetical protein E2C01_064542 [Portunus trituberculatus]|uniref:Secreted protein n=1 Tax=Portunus trituberculatus TaxID=210409 RepID=A0A5B7HNL4_PORTR|nr:hypothetical protein [Portunus trituberculatus]